jgi:hypothetical protein
VLSFMDFPKAPRKQLASTNPLERLNAEIKRRTDVLWIFPNDAAIVRVRHSHATIIASQNAPQKAVQERLGHATSRMTADVYTHATTTIQDQAVSALDNFYAAAAVSGQISGQIVSDGTPGQAKIPQSLAGLDFVLVEDNGVEPLTSCMPCNDDVYWVSARTQ